MKPLGHVVLDEFLDQVAQMSSGAKTRSPHIKPLSDNRS
jgi:hypothetical protein